MKTVLITGSSTGIGEDCALHLDRLGFKVFAGIRKEADANGLRSKSSDNLVPLTIDVKDSESIASAAHIVSENVGDAGLDGLVNNAGVVMAGPLEFLPLDALREQYEVNVIGQIAVTQAFLPLLRKAKGRVINMGSIGGIVAKPFVGPYGSSKAALEGLTDTLRMELSLWGLHVSIIEPGGIATPIWEKSRDSTMSLLQQMPKEAMDLYGHGIDGMRAVAERMAKGGVPVEEVTRVVHHALTSSKPKTRYLVGRQAKLQYYLSKILPDRMMDRMILKKIGLLPK